MTSHITKFQAHFDALRDNMQAARFQPDKFNPWLAQLLVAAASQAQCEFEHGLGFRSECDECQWRNMLVGWNQAFQNTQWTDSVWENTLANSQDKLASVARRAREEYEAGETELLEICPKSKKL